MAVRESQETMWRAIDGMSKDVQELVQKDAGTEEDDDIEPTPVVEEPALAGTSAIAQPTPKKTVPPLTFFTIPEEDVVSVKDSVTFGLFAHGSMEGMEVGGSSGQPVAPQFKFGGSFVAAHGGTDDMGKTALMPQKEEKGELSLGPMVASGWKSKDYSAPAEESVSLVGKSTVLPEDHLRGFCTPHCWGWLDEVGGPTAILGQTATRGVSLAPFAHKDGLPGWNPWTNSRRQREMR